MHKDLEFFKIFPNELNFKQLFFLDLVILYIKIYFIQYL